ncbi:MAG: TetR/AcrR family transcriptional regulator, partial [Actinomycetes bacterium]
MTSDEQGGRAEAPVSGDELGDEDSERRILDAAVGLVEEHGESNFRISDLVERSGRSVGSIYHFFGSREGVLEAVWMHQMAPWAETDLHRLSELTAHVNTVADFRNVVVTMSSEIHQPERSEALWSKIEIIAASRRRPNLRRVIAAHQHQMTTAYADVVRSLQLKGLIRAELDAWALAVFIQAYTFGRILGQSDGTDNFDLGSWIDIVLRSFDGGILA